MKIRVENGYSDGHESLLFYDIPDREVPDDLEDMWDFLFQYTGDGHGAGNDLGWYYEVTIVDAEDPDLIGLHWENCGN